MKNNMSKILCGLVMLLPLQLIAAGNNGKGMPDEVRDHLNSLNVSDMAISNGRVFDPTTNEDIDPMDQNAVDLEAEFQVEDPEALSAQHSFTIKYGVSYTWYGLYAEYSGYTKTYVYATGEPHNFDKVYVKLGNSVLSKSKTNYNTYQVSYSTSYGCVFCLVPKWVKGTHMVSIGSYTLYKYSQAG